MSAIATILSLCGLSILGAVVGVMLVLLVAERQSKRRGEGGLK